MTAAEERKGTNLQAFVVLFIRVLYTSERRCGHRAQPARLRLSRRSRVGANERKRRDTTQFRDAEAQRCRPSATNFIACHRMRRLYRPKQPSLFCCYQCYRFRSVLFGSATQNSFAPKNPNPTTFCWLPKSNKQQIQSANRWKQRDGAVQQRRKEFRVDGPERIAICVHVICDKQSARSHAVVRTAAFVWLVLDGVSHRVVLIAELVSSLFF
mmetsp:Transcript_11109/g.22426  ORF Transcript_11109/g.22426 Transcript_11109/m.22426 type:complete len:212 (-) Transcript_11109:247-882(-)